MTTRQELYKRQRELIQQIQDIADGYAELSKHTDKILKTQERNGRPLSRVEARGYNG